MSTLVTGAGNGLGRLAALRAAAAGHAVAALDVEAHAVATTVARSPRSRAYPCEITDADAVDEAVARAGEELGPIETVVHAAGLCEIGSALTQPRESLRRVMDVNYFGSVHLARAVLPAMRERGSGALVLFGSLSGWVPSPALAAYSASKAAVAAYCEVLTHELDGSGVRVLCVCPGQVETRLAQRVRAVDPGVLGGQRGSEPAAVLDAVERALADPDAGLFCFPTRTDRLIWRARRFAPRALGKQVAAHARPR